MPMPLILTIKMVVTTKVTKAIKTITTMVNTTSKELQASNNTKVNAEVVATILKKIPRPSAISP